MIPTLAVVGGKSMWYLTRGSGVVALLMLTASVMLGLLTSGRWESRRWPRFVIEGLHRNVSLAVLVFLAIHVSTTVLDGFVPLGWLDVILPFRAGYRPVWIGLGALAVDCLLAIIITSLLRVRIGHAAWRNIHLLAYASWPIALVHGLGAGTDAALTWNLALDGASLLAVLATLGWRMAVRRPARRGVTPALVALSTTLPVLIVLFALTGPLRAGWNSHGARLGAPAKTVASASASAPGPTASVPAATTLTLPLDARVQGARSVHDTAETRTITLEGQPASGAFALRIDLVGAPSGGGVVFDHGTVSIAPAGASTAWQGTVDALQHSVVAVVLEGPSGQHAVLTAHLTINRTNETMTASVHIGAATAPAAADPVQPAHGGDD